MINKDDFKERFGHFDKEIVVEIINIFIEEYDDRITKITAYIEEQNIDALRKAIHGFKGVIANFDNVGQAYKKGNYIENETAELLQEINQGRTFSSAELIAFFNKIRQEFENFKLASFELLAELKHIKNDYL